MPFASSVSRSTARDDARRKGTRGQHQRTRTLLEELFNGPFAARRPRLAYTLAIREAPLRVLHAQQIDLLKTWRAHAAADRLQESEAMLPDLLLSINALASGLRTTG